MIYVNAMRRMQHPVDRTDSIVYHVMGLMHQNMRMVYSELNVSVLLFNIVFF
jgi:hypothetical protein